MYFDKYKYERLLEFLTHLDNKFSADWIAQYTPTDRIENMNKVIKVVEGAVRSEQIFADPCFKIDADGFTRAVESSVYGRRFTRYLLIKLDYFYQDHAHRMVFELYLWSMFCPRIQPTEANGKRISGMSSGRNGLTGLETLS